MYQGQRENQGREEDDPGGSRVHLEPFREEQRRDHVERDADGQDQADQIRDHSRSTPRWIRPSKAKTATVSTVNTTTDMNSTTSIRVPDENAPGRVKSLFEARPTFLTAP
ncbi:hypothetical protein GCM10027088_11620 [Nocardia goodfellowii]